MNHPPFHHSGITGVILAGGRGSRMGGKDKGLMPYRNRALYLHVLQRLQPQVTTVWINANRNIEVYQQSGLPVICDTLANFSGPLAGMLTALTRVTTEWVMFAPCDTPALPDNLVERLWYEKGGAPAVWVCTEQRDHPTLALVHASIAEQLRHYLASGERRLMVFLQQADGHRVLFSGQESYFKNINYPDDLG